MMLPLATACRAPNSPALATRPIQREVGASVADGKWDHSFRGARLIPSAAKDEAQPSARGRPQTSDWGSNTAVPSYLQSQEENSDVCDEWGQALMEAEAGRGTEGGSNSVHDAESAAVWGAIRREAERDAASEPLLSSFLYASILAHGSFERSLAFILANRLYNSTMLPTQLFEIFEDVLCRDEVVPKGALADVQAVRERDPACTSYCGALLYYKGFHALQVHRIANSLWKDSRKVLALALQSRVSEVFAVDIHPAATVGRGVLMDHGTGVVIGETAVVGNNVSLLQGVTLGGTGKEVGDRHPKISNNVLIGACATILGNIKVGRGAQIAAGSLVLKPVPPHTVVAGSPAKEVGRVVSSSPSTEMDHWSRKWQYDPFSDPRSAAEEEQSTQEPEAMPAAGMRGEGSEAQAGKPVPQQAVESGLDASSSGSEASPRQPAAADEGSTSSSS